MSILQLITPLPLAWIFFASPWMLLAGLGIAIPIAIHLWRHHPKQEVSWGAMRFLEQAMQRQRRQLSLQQWLLLAVRCLAIVALAMAVARPFQTARSGYFQALESNPPRLLILAIDDSYSMLAPSGTGVLLDEAKRLAIEQAEPLGSQDALAFLPMVQSEASRAATFDHASILQAIRQFDATEQASTLAPFSANLKAMILQTVERFPQIQQVEICVLSDLGSNTWIRAATEELRATLESLPLPHQLFLPSISVKPYPNCWVEELTSHGTGILGTSLQLRAKIGGQIPTSFEANPGQKSEFGSGFPLELELWIDKQRVEAKGIDASEFPMEVLFDWQPTTPGSHLVECRLKSDSLAVDNSRYLVCHTKVASRILLLEPQLEEGKFLDTALRCGPSPVQVQRKLASTVTEADLNEIDGLILCDVALLDSESMERVMRFVEGGGFCLWTCGRHYRPESFQPWHDPTAVGTSSLPFHMDQVLASIDLVIDPLDYRSRLVAPFRDFPESGLLSIPVEQYWHADQLQEEVVVDLAFSNQHPLIFHHPFGEGLFYWVTTPWTLAVDASATKEQLLWNGMAASPSFVPLVQGILEEMQNRDSQSRPSMVGQSLHGQVAKGRGGELVEIETPGHQQQNRTLDSHQPPQWYWSSVAQQGFYIARSAAHGYEEPLAVNIDTTESHQTFCDRSSLPTSWLKPTTSTSPFPILTSPSLPASQWMLGLSLFLLVFESTYTTWMLRRAKG